MKLDVAKIAKEAFKDKKLIIENSSKDAVKINYMNNLDWRGNYNRKPFILPRKLEIDEGFMEGLGLFLGDGDMNRKEKGHLTYCSIDKDIARYALKFLQNYFYFMVEDGTFLLNYRKKNPKMVNEWSSYLNIPKEKIITRNSKRHRNESLQIQVNGVIFRKVFDLAIKYALSKDIIKCKALRRALLRGLFAAEGNVGIDYLEKKQYIVKIGFALNINENHLKSYICKILHIENINFRIREYKKGNSVEISTSSWANYWKLWKLNIFDLCERKKIKFTKIMRNLKIYCILNDEVRYKFFNSLNLRQKDIAYLIGSWQGNVSKTIKGIHPLTIEQLKLLQGINKFSLKKLKMGITSVRIGSLTEINEKEFLDFMWSYKLNQENPSL